MTVDVYGDVSQCNDISYKTVNNYESSQWYYGPMIIMIRL